MITVFGLIILLMMAFDVHAATTHVKTTSNDSNACGAADSSPKLTINAALNCYNSSIGAGANNIVEVWAGTYNEMIDSVNAPFPSGTSWSAPFTLRAHAGDTVTIRKSGELNLRIFSDSQQYSIISGFVFDGANLTGTGGGSVTLGSCCNGGSFVRLQNNEFINSVISANTDLNALFIGRFSTNDEILNNRIHGLVGGAYPLYIQGQNNLFEGNELYNFLSFGFHLYSGYPEQPNGNIIRKNIVHDFGSAVPAAGILVAGRTGNQVYNNIVYNGSKGIDVWASNTPIYNNTVYNMTNTGIETTRSSGAIVKNNIIYQTSPNIAFGSSVTASNNLCDSAGTGCTTGTPPRLTSAAIPFPIRPPLSFGIYCPVKGNFGYATNAQGTR